MSRKWSRRVVAGVGLLVVALVGCEVEKEMGLAPVPDRGSYERIKLPPPRVSPAAPAVQAPSLPEALALPQDHQPPPARSGRHALRTVTRVVDGDTIVFDGGEKVRLIGIDTPESVHPSKPVERFAKEASAFTRRIVEGKQVWVEYDQTRTDKYGRTLAYVHLADGRVLNEEIIRQGYAHAYTRFPFKYMERYRSLQRQACKAAVGLWAVDPKAHYVTRAPVSAKRRTPTNETGSATVYVTRTGKKYHRGHCSYLRRSKIPSTLRDATARGYRPCSRCNPPRGSSSYGGTSSRPTRPGVAESGSYYGEISPTTGKPKTIYVRGYFRKDGTYVRGHYRSR